ncbi:MAG: asparagine synthase (glutamine-hydrolyzing), partial [Actinomycetota bacterium]
MCGICGIVNAPAEAGANAATVTTMTEDLERRGPDASGSWTSPDGATSLGFRRLAIIDPTPAGAQPMWSADGDAVLVFNGEIYNHPELRRELERDGHRFRSSSDTEVLLEGLRRWDTELLPRLRGMFALALYRPETGSLLLARDHAGIKPLFFARAPGGTGVAFSSRYDSLFRTGWLDPDRFRPDALAEYVARRHVGRSAALHEHAAQVGPGEWVRIGADGRESRRTWWRLEAPSDPDLRGEEAVEATKSVIDTAVRRHLLSDVPVGVFLSGGVDSPLVAGTATDLADRRYDGFTVGYPGWDQDETAAAGRMAEPLRIDHHVRAVTGAPADTVPAVMAAQDEPVNDWSIVPTLLVSDDHHLLGLIAQDLEGERPGVTVEAGEPLAVPVVAVDGRTGQPVVVEEPHVVAEVHRIDPEHR